ncbi:MAG: T9SS type A sorting domain-containing protein [Bacteroidales bacterium]|nr:T9SS type A sorting domain-containing protein [Bacteroidales bacterium]
MNPFNKFWILLALAGLSMSNVMAQSGNVGPRGSFYDDPADGIYVSPNGDDATATGAKEKPYKSINTALNAAINDALPSATIVLRGGTYQERRDVRVRMSNVTIKSRKGEWAVIDLTNYDPGHNEDSGVLFYAEDAITGGVVTDCKLQSVEVTGGFYTVCCETQWEWPVSPEEHGPGVSNIIIEDCVLHHSTNDAVKVKPGCENITIRYNEIHHSGQAYAHLPDFNTGEHNSEGIDNVNGNGMHVHNNYIHDLCSTGIYAKGGATDVIIENNIVERAYAGGIMLGFDTSPRYFDIDANPQYYENIRGTVRNNLVIDAGWEGIGLYASKDAQVYNNTVVNAVSGPLKYHSPIYFGVATQDWDNPAGCPPSVNPNVHHNIVAQPASYTNRMIDVRYVTDFYNPDDYPDLPSYDLSALDGNPTMNNNCYHVSGKNATFTDNRPPAVENMGLAAWQTHISGDNGSIETDPALDTDYMPTNTQCSDMGLLYPLILNDPMGIVSPSRPEERVRVYPNPTRGVITICDVRCAICDVEVFDVMGRLTSPNPSKGGGLGAMTMDISYLPAGVYFVRITTDGGVVTRKVILSEP